MEMQKLIPKRPRGFALLSLERREEIAAQGGHAAHACGRAHHFTPEEARAAGRRGGRAVAENHGHRAAIGRSGALERARRWQQQHAARTLRRIDKILWYPQDGAESA